MPTTQLMQKLSGKLASRLRGSNSAGPELHRSADPMDCTPSFEVVAEVLPLSPGSRTGSMCSGSSNSDGEARQEEASTADSRAHRPSFHSAALLAVTSSSGHPLPSSSVGSQPATARALRARGKAMLRTETGLPSIATSLHPSLELGLQQQLSLESSSSMMDATTFSHLASPRYVRSATAPLPGSLPAAQQLSLTGPGRSGANVSASRPLHDDDEEEDADELVHPMSPAAAEDAGAPEHCHWEDGVIASWLQGFDHSELLNDEEGHEEQPQQQKAAAAGACSKAASVPGPHLSRSMPNTVYSSALYN